MVDSALIEGSALADPSCFRAISRSDLLVREPLHCRFAARRIASRERRASMADLAAHITDTVVKIEKKPGDAVSEGDVLVVLE